MKLSKRWWYLFLFSILIICNGCKPSASTTSTANPNVATSTPGSGTTVTLTGSLTYDYVPATTGRLNYAATVQRPMRNVYVELLNASTDAVLGTYNTNESGQYSFSVMSGTTVKLRVYAEMKNPPVIIQDNTGANAEYAVVSPSFSLTTNTVRDVRASSGWSGTNSTGSYSGTRMAAPFAMLDSIYTITKKINAARPTITFPLLKLNWSVNNVSVSGDRTIGQIGTSHYDPSSKQLYILGQADVDSDEFDNHIIVHEWGHFFEDNLSRSDSRGGSHGSGDVKDMSLAFGEGWGNALSAMAFDPDVLYTDTYGSRQQSGFQINMESGLDSNKGWYSETSIQQILYDIYDSTNETGDNLTMGIGPIIDVLTNHQKTTTAATSIFSFINGLKSDVPSAAVDLNTLLATKNIAAIADAYGSSETNDAGWNKNLPIYNSLTLGGAAVSLSLYGDVGSSDYYGLYNTAFNNKYLKFTASSSTTRLVVSTTDTFQMDVYYQGTLVDSQYRSRNSASVIGPFTFDIPTTAGREYRVNILTDRGVVYDHAANVNLSVTGSAL